MESEDLPEGKIKTLSYIDIIGGGILLLTELLGAMVIFSSSEPIAEMFVNPGVFSFLFIGILAVVMAETGNLLVERFKEKTPNIIGWTLLVLAGLSVVDVVKSIYISPGNIPVFVYWTGIGISMVSRILMISGGVFLRRLL